jgi:hypothetical protein
VTDLAREAALLRSPDAAGLLLAALTGDPASELPGFTARLTAWHFRPGSEVTAGYEVGYPDGSGELATETLFATSADAGPDAVTVARDGLRFAVWRHPFDPRLPGLAAACDPHTVLGWLATTTPTSTIPTAFDLTLLGYRPLRRAVLRATADDGVHFIKVLRPERAERLAVRQKLFADAGLTPAVAARPAPGVLLTPTASGRPLASCLASPGPDLPTADALVGLLDRLPAGLTALPRRPAWADRLDFHTATAIDRLPGQAARLTALAARLQRVLDAAPVGPVVPTHGDFYEANLLVDGPQLSLIDLDASGPGLREDDLACMLAHVAVLPGLSPGHYTGVPEVLHAWTDGFAARVHPAALFARVSAVILSLVAGGRDAQAELRLGLAEQWAERSLQRIGRHHDESATSMRGPSSA